MTSVPITTCIVCIVSLMAQDQHNASAHGHLHSYCLIITLGDSIVRVYFRPRLPHDC